MMGFYGDGTLSLFGMSVAIIIHAGFALAVIAAVYWLVSSIVNSVRESWTRQLLTARFVKGEISEIEYKRMKEIFTIARGE